MTRPLKLSTLILLLLLFTACDLFTTPEPEPDTTSPTISLKSSLSTVTEAGQLILSTTVDDNVAVSSVSFFQDGNLLRTDNKAPFSANTTLSSANNGTIIFKATARDAAGNSNDATVNVTVNISDGNKNLTLNSSSTNVTNTGNITLTATLSDTTDVAKVEFYKGATKIGEDTSTPYTSSTNLSSADNGTVTFRAEAKDSQGETLSSNSTDVIVNIEDSGSNINAQDDSYEALVNTLIEVGVSASGKAAVRVSGSVLDNDEGSSLSISGTASEANGSVDMQNDGTFTFIPDAGFIGNASFTYTVTNGSQSQTSSVIINVKEANPDVSGNQKIVYIDNSNGGFGNGSANAPYNTLLDITNSAGFPTSQTEEGDIIFVFGKEDYSCVVNCVVMKNGQQLIGQGASLDVNGLSVSTGSSSNKTVLKDSNNNSIEIASDSTIKGFRIENAGVPSGDPFSASAIGNAFYRGSKSILPTNQTSGELIVENIEIDTTKGFGIFIDDASFRDNPFDSGTGNYAAVFDMTIRNVQITNAGTMSIWLDDPKILVIEDTDITGVKKNSAGNSFDFSGRAIEAQTQFDGDFTFRNVNISSTDVSDSLRGFYILKNDGIIENDPDGNNGEPYPGTYDLTVNLSNNSTAMTSGVAYYIQVNQADEGNITLSGSNNQNTAAASTYVFEDNSTGPSAKYPQIFSGVSCSGSIMIAGSSRGCP